MTKKAILEREAQKERVARLTKMVENLSEIRGLLADAVKKAHAALSNGQKDLALKVLSEAIVQEIEHEKRVSELFDRE